MPPKSHLPKVQTIVDEAVCNNLIYMAKTHRSPPAKNRDSAEIFGGQVARIEREGSNLRQVSVLWFFLKKTLTITGRFGFWIFIPSTTASWSAQLSQSSNHRTSTFCWLIPWSATSHCQVLTFSVSIQKMVDRTYRWAFQKSQKLLPVLACCFNDLWLAMVLLKRVLLLMEDIPGM